jgi:hypothetical protein
LNGSKNKIQQGEMDEIRCHGSIGSCHFDLRSVARGASDVRAAKFGASRERNSHPRNGCARK